MTEQETVQFWKRAIAYAKRRGQDEDRAQDFGSFAVTKHLENPNAVNLEWIFSDFFRRATKTRKDDPHYQVKMAGYRAQSLDAPLSDDNDSTLHDVVATPEPSSGDDQVELEELAFSLVPEWAKPYVKLRWLGLPRYKIARLCFKRRPGTRNLNYRGGNGYGPNVARAFRQWPIALAKAKVLQLKEEAGESCEIDTRLDIQWVTLP